MRVPLAVSLASILLLASCAPAEKEGIRASRILIGSEVNARQEITNPKKKFSSSERTFHAHVFVEGHTESVQVMGAWWYVQGNRKIFETSAGVTPSFPVAKFVLGNSRGDWPEGEYRFTVMVKGNEIGEEIITVRQ